MIAEVAADHLGSQRLTLHLEVLPGELPRRLDRFRSTAGEEHTVEIAGGERREASGELDRGGVGVGPDREEGQGLGLSARCGSEAGLSVARLGRVEAGETIEVALALSVPDIAALAALNDGHAVDAAAET